MFVDPGFVEGDVELGPGSPQAPRVEKHSVARDPGLKKQKEGFSKLSALIIWIRTHVSVKSLLISDTMK